MLNIPMAVAKFVQEQFILITGYRLIEYGDRMQSTLLIFCR
ncbi:hypothetical protein C427_1831 [Paraglaciecola psychrophila 170]|uniref:Uncharacterized protein n=1 Tax=Paraglaciecola psychrophila 170 TaxID=1129794 RepID=K7APX0_9ALTE|nr:hypothetical protein C427_1831 [Paraglaciecola psychrophila 170]GAC37340.1 hypothetical protein GPSY_1711 [Paraglaciecola psychrophila 170]